MYIQRFTKLFHTFNFLTVIFSYYINLRVNFTIKTKSLIPKRMIICNVSNNFICCCINIIYVFILYFICPFLTLYIYIIYKKIHAYVNKLLNNLVNGI